MWYNVPLLKSTITSKNEDLPLILQVSGGYIGYSNILGRALLFEHESNWYIIQTIAGLSSYRLGFFEDIYVDINAPFYMYKEGSRFLAKKYSYRSSSEKWKRIKFTNIDGEEEELTSVGRLYELDESSKLLKPYNIATGSESLADLNIQFVRGGNDVYKSSTKLGVYEWQGEEEEDDIIVGWRHYTHKAIDSEGNQTAEDINVYEQEGLQGSKSSWRYSYNGVNYFYNYELPLLDFYMTGSEDKKIKMNYVKLSERQKKQWHTESGATYVV